MRLPGRLERRGTTCRVVERGSSLIVLDDPAHVGQRGDPLTEAVELQQKGLDHRDALLRRERDPGRLARRGHGAETSPELQGTELVAQQIREEGHRLVSHPLREVERLERVAAQGESPATPLIVVLGISLVLAAIVAVVLSIALGVYYAVGA